MGSFFEQLSINYKKPNSKCILMKYDIVYYNNAVSEYKSKLGRVKGKVVFVVFDLDDEDAYFSIAPLSEAVHDLGGDMSVIVKNQTSEVLDSLRATWALYKRLKRKENSKETEALSEFISFVDAKAKGRFERIFKAPEIMIEAGKSGFKGSVTLPYRAKWFKKYRWNKLVQTSDVILRQVFNIKKGERFGIGFELMLANKDIDKPKEDYLDSYAICRAMLFAARKYADVSMSAQSPRMSMLLPMERTSDLRVTLLGCELSKNINEEAMLRFRPLSQILKTNRLKVNDSNFFISGKGYPGKHVFGEVIGYPSPNKKTRWQSPGGFIYKLDHSPQTRFDPREPMSRFAFTDTLPIDLYIDACNIDWLKMERRNDVIKRIAEKCEKFIVRSNINEKYTTNLEVGLVKPDGTHRWARGSDVDTRFKINKEYYKRTGIKAGTMANIPGGEMFLTPEYIDGVFVGDVVISIDQSYRLSPENPLVVKCSREGYKIISGPKDIIAKLEKKKREAWQNLLKMEKYKSLPQEVVDMKKRNFNMIGEFAINTNPKARLSDYLIVNEKIANMMHIALGSGFEPDRSTEYHTDIVFDAPRQKLDVYAVNKKGRKYWVLKKGKFVV
ncbi:MAG: hypothetical protein QXK37_00130 [Candidatus Woesearchaeota archaeon]